MKRYELIDNKNWSSSAIVTSKRLTFTDIVNISKNKLRLKKPIVLYDTAGNMIDADLLDFPEKMYVSTGDVKFAKRNTVVHAAPVYILAKQAEVDTTSIQQLEAVAKLPGVISVHGMPDLHDGPNGCVIVSSDCVYPRLVGNDIGCGMSVFRYDGSLKPGKAVSERPLDQECLSQIKEKFDLPSGDHDFQLGSIGAGNHFAEICRVDKVFYEVPVPEKDYVLLVHSGSRALGKAIFEEVTEPCLHPGDAFDKYIKRHDYAVRWARANRMAIACRILNSVQDPLLDVCHNYVAGDGAEYRHRKGAVPTDQGFVLLPGSRGHSSFILKPKQVEHIENSKSLAHGAGRRLSRAAAKLKANKPGYRDESTVIGSDKHTQQEEIPEAYKNVSDVVSDLAPYADIAAELTPVVTYKG